MYKKLILGSLIAFLTSPALSQDQPQCSTVAECAQKAMEAAHQTKTAIRIAIPHGSVMAFNLPSCPEGWAEFAPLAGRTIVGAGKGHDLTERKVGNKGGAEMHTLTVEQMPSHTHSYTFTDHHNTPSNTDYSSHEFGNSNTKDNTSTAGGNQSHNNMQPFHVLRYCERK